MSSVCDSKQMLSVSEQQSREERGAVEKDFWSVAGESGPDARIYPWGDTRRFNSYSNYFRKLFGGRVQKVTINAGFSCPNRDGTVGVGGCSFCNNEAFSPSYCTPEKSVSLQLAEGMAFHTRRYRHADKYLAYFQAYSNTHGALSRLQQVYDEALAVDHVVGIVVGTRPDCVDGEKLDYFARLSERHYVMLEYGIESCYDETLRAVNRGHDFATAQRAVQETAARGIHVGGHFILGFPGETRAMLLEQVDLINALPLNTVKFHQLQLFKGTALGDEYLAHPATFSFFELDEYLDFFGELLSRLRPDLVVERFAGEAPPRFHLNPGWGHVRNEALLQLFEKRLETSNLYQGKFYKGSGH